MSSFLDQIQAIDNAITRSTLPQIEPRSLRRKKARDAKAAKPKQSRPVSNNLVNQK